MLDAALASRLKVIGFAVDGVLTDGGVYVRHGVWDNLVQQYLQERGDVETAYRPHRTG